MNPFIKIDNNVCVSGGWLIEKEIMSKDNYKKLVKRKKINRIKRASYMSPALITFNSLPERFKQKVVKEAGNPYKEKKNILERNIIENLQAKEFFQNYKLPDGRYLDVNKQNVYYNNCILLEAMHRTYNIFVTTRKKCDGPIKPAWGQVIKLLEDIDYIPHSLGSSKRLKDKMNKYMKEGFKNMVPKYYLNRNKAKVATEEQISLIRQLLRDPKNLNNEQIANLYNQVANKSNWGVITANAVRVYRQKYKLSTISGAKGARTFDTTKSMQVKRTAPITPLSYWTLDGWNAELLYQKTDNNSQGNNLTTYHNRPTIVVVLDPFINYPVGYAIGTHETPELIKAAVRNAINHTKELFGERYKVLQLQSDNYGKGTLKPFYEAITEVYTPARVGNAKAKVIEPFFKSLNVNYCQLQSNWSGFGINSRKESQPNSEWLNKNKNNFPDFNGVVEQLSKAIESKRASLKDKYVEAFNALPGEKKIKLSDEDYLFWLGERTGYTNRLAHDGLRMKLNRNLHVYDSFDMNFRRLSHIDWIIAFDPNDMKKILVHDERGEARFLLEEKHRQPMAINDQTDQDRVELKKVKTYNKELKEVIMQEVAKDDAVVTEMFENNKELENTITKHVLTDSLGQNKNYLRREVEKNLANNQKIISQQIKKSNKTDQKSWNDIQLERAKKTVDISKYKNID